MFNGAHDAGGTSGGSSAGQNQGYFNGPNIALCFRIYIHMLTSDISIAFEQRPTHQHRR